MKMTRDRLQNITQTFINKRLRSDHSIICIYLVGSMLKEDPFINGSADVDLVVVHDIPVENSREIISISIKPTTRPRAKCAKIHGSDPRSVLIRLSFMGRGIGLSSLGHPSKPVFSTRNT